MKKLGLAAVILMVICSCDPILYNGGAYRGGRSVPARIPQEETFKCDRLNTQPVKSAQLYEDYYGSILTRDASWLRTPGGNYRWGIANSKPLSLAHFGAYVKPSGKYGRFRANIYIDPAVKADMTFTFRDGSYNGVVLRNLVLHPGGTETVDIDIAGVRKLYIGSDIRINHDMVKKIVIGDPEFYNCR